MRQVCADRMISFGQAGQADKIKQISLEEMAKRYKA
jgi:fructose-bisphosphate aldolase class II